MVCPDTYQSRKMQSTIALVLIVVNVYVVTLDSYWNSVASHLESCYGRKIISGEKGFISDGPKEYNSSSHCEWLIDAGSPNKSIHLQFRTLESECSFDFLFVYDGNSYSSPLLASLSGDSLPSPVTAKSGYMLLYLYSDQNYVKDGFEAYYIVYDCTWNCSYHGVCLNHKCLCHDDYYGDFCQHRTCDNDCSGHGACVPVSRHIRRCKCDKGFLGSSCNISILHYQGGAHWSKLESAENSFKGRTSHAAVFIEESECLWVFGGFDLNMVLEDLFRYCLGTNLWEDMSHTSKPWPSARMGHAMAAYRRGFYVFGGLLRNGLHTDELWFYNTTSEIWVLKSLDSSVKPKALSGHTLTAVRNWLYVIGGKTDERVSSDHLFRISAIYADAWELVGVKGGSYPPKRLVGHSTVYHQESNSLIVFGGYKQSSALFSDRTGLLLSFSIYNNHWIELSNSAWSDQTRPRERAFHSAVRIGQYMVVYGGNTHDHDDLEICYNPLMYFYHLDCHIWLNHTHFTGRVMPSGRFGHVAVVANNSSMLVVGGYSGQVLDDLLIFHPPHAVVHRQSPFNNDADHCQYYRVPKYCIDDPECIFCKRDSEFDLSSCHHRYKSHMCMDEPFHHHLDRCPGICHALHSCSACVSHGHRAHVKANSIRHHLHVQPCSWCVNEAQCQRRSDPNATCKSPDLTPSGHIGWWGGLSASLTTLLQCQHRDFPSGLHWIRYHRPINHSYPDQVIIKRTTSATVGQHPTTHSVEGDFTSMARFVGFLHPLNVHVLMGNRLQLYLGISQAQARLYLSSDKSVTNVEKVISTGRVSMFNQTTARRKSGLPLFPSLDRGHKYFLLQETEQLNVSSGLKMLMQRSEVSLSWNGGLSLRSGRMSREITYEFLEPFSHGNCSQHYNCLACLTDSLCSWCQPSRSCVLRNLTGLMCVRAAVGKDVGVPVSHLSEQYYITHPSECPTCADYVQCFTCVQDRLCEWVERHGHCTRRYRVDDAVRRADRCRPPCHRRSSCSECVLETDQCVWCENTATCSPFSDHVTRYIYGQCTSWTDATTPAGSCRTCGRHATCAACQGRFGCGWCSDDDNPLTGVCLTGGFDGPTGDFTCSQMATDRLNVTSDFSWSWSYGSCPNVEECRLGIHHCQKNTTCFDTFDGYECRCNRGFKSNGLDICEPTCYNDCQRGHCSGHPNFVCLCDLGWTGVACTEDCLCSGHSTCLNGTGRCDVCRHHTAGTHCGLCSHGSYGTAQDAGGCKLCHCNGHGDPAQGECHSNTGECFCVNSTIGTHCDRCEEGFYGNPTNGGRCYRQCSNRVIMRGVKSGALGLHKGGRVRDTTKVYCLWILSAFGDGPLHHPPFESTRIIVLNVEGDMEVECGRDAIEVYDGVPAYINGTFEDSSRQLGAICGSNPGRDISMYAYSGVITIFFEADLLDTSPLGFNATYSTVQCLGGCSTSRDDWNWKCVGGKCVCEKGFFGPQCQQVKCPRRCFSDRGQGTCDVMNGICRCAPNYAGTDCSRLMKTAPNIEMLVDGQRSSGDSRFPAARAGHTLLACGHLKLYVFGGFSLEHGLLGDLWSYDQLNGEWERLEPRIFFPAARYLHAGACVPGRMQMFFYGGFVQLTGQDIVISNPLMLQPTNQLWIFNVASRMWENALTPPWMPGLVGHTFTYVGDNKLVLIGGFSPHHYFSNNVYVYDADSVLMNWQEVLPETMSGAYPIGIYGHSAVYNQPSNSMYVFGGYLFRSGGWSISRELYSYDVGKRQWNLFSVPAANFVPRKSTWLPGVKDDSEHWEGRAFHTTVATDNEMITIGGLLHDGRFATEVLLYRYHCGTWHRIPFDGELVAEYKTIRILGLKAAIVGGHVFMFGGFDGGSMTGNLARLTLPEDICNIFPYDDCLQTMGCHVCGNVSSVQCFTAGRQHMRPLRCPLLDLVESFKRCDAHWFSSLNCSSFKSCSKCLSRHPQFKSVSQRCHWCSSCFPPSCVPAKQCLVGEECQPEEHIIRRPSSCLEYLCPASDCESCSQLNKCFWTQHFHRSSENGRFYNKDPVYNWVCVPHSLRTSSSTGFVGYPPGQCPHRCYLLHNCSHCLSSVGVEGGSQECVWSAKLQECMPPDYLPLRCLFGECGYIHSGQAAGHCPAPCHTESQCSHCISQPGCGWCALAGMNGEGLCIPGGLSGPSSTAAVSCSDSSIRNEIGLYLGQTAGVPVWAFESCPTESECTNGHHTCDEMTEDCYDTFTAFRCECKQGYIRNVNSRRCEPICHQGCIHGTCVRPDHCRCHFGIVGGNCSVECRCHKHSHCLSVSKRDVCLQCRNNTMGRQCEVCRPFYVGNPRIGEDCIPCRHFCLNHTDLCVGREENEVRMMGSQPRVLMVKSKGPSRSDAICLNCLHNTTGDNCDQCSDGHFRQQGQPLTSGCMPCHCHGHSDRCTRETGENCACQNNTETDCQAKDGLKCWQIQCSKCKEYFLGTPTDGHQCYRQMAVDLEYCLDPNSQTDCLHDPVPLLPGRTVFYAVQPKYLNVDIRVTIDITEGSADVFFSNRDDMFQVFVDRQQGFHSVTVDPTYRIDTIGKPAVPAESGTHSRLHKRTADFEDAVDGNASFGEHSFEHIIASRLITYFTVIQDTVLVIRDAQFRVVVTIPERYHNLRLSRFYIVVQSRSQSTSLEPADRKLTGRSLGDAPAGRSGEKTYGILYFRQDQPHIDLFIFFSVFFSCFFLFLLICISMWKVKQAFSSRRSRQLREREMECMASRPFAKVLVFFSAEDPAIGKDVSSLHNVGSETLAPDSLSLHRNRDGGGGGGSLISTMYHRTSGPASVRQPRHSYGNYSDVQRPGCQGKGYCGAGVARDEQFSISIIPIAVEPTEDGAAAVTTVLFQLPGATHAACALCLGSSLTTPIAAMSLSNKAAQRRLTNPTPC